MSALRDLVDDYADLGSESDDEDFDEETGEARRPKKRSVDLDDSSEEESEDEEAARAVQEGFIVDEDEDDDEERNRRRRERKKRRREEREEEGGLDDEDLDLIGEANPELARLTQNEPKFKRLKRGHKEDREPKVSRGAGDLFDSDEEDENRDFLDDRRKGHQEDEFADFIEQDFEDEEEGEDKDAEVTRIVRGGYGAIRDTVGLDETALEDFKEAFGDGTEYDWALSLQDREEDERRYDPDDPDALGKKFELKDVFEPSQLEEKMLTEEDDVIRRTDQPERFQLARKPYQNLLLTEAQKQEEPLWISTLLLPKKHLGSHLNDPFQKSVAKVLEFLNDDEYEVPFIFQHRKDYLIHAARVPTSPGMNGTNDTESTLNAEKLLNQSDLWDIFDLDLKFRALIEKRNALQKTYDNLKAISSFTDAIFEEMLPLAVSMEELQDVQDYLYFQHSSKLSDLAVTNGSVTNGSTQRRPGATRILFEKIRTSKVYNLVKAFGITADDFAQNSLRREGRRQYTEDPTEKPDVMASSEDILDPPNYSSGPQCLRAAKAMFAEEISVSPKMRKVLRQKFYASGVIESFRTEKGLRKIDEQHPYYEFKYLRNQQLFDIADKPGMFLRMLKAEEEGLVEVRVRLQDQDSFKKTLYGDLESDNFSEVAEAWNKQRREALDIALDKLIKAMARGLKENMKAECENQVARNCRENFYARLDQAPFKPKGMQVGTIPRVIALSNGTGNIGRDPIFWAWVEEDGRVLENGKFVDLSIGESNRSGKDGADLKAFVELVNRRRPDVIAVSGFSVETRKLVDLLENIVKAKDLHGADFEDEDGRDINEPLDVVIINDEIARLYQTSERAATAHPAMHPLTKYCIALAKYMQNPMKEYASLGRDLISVSFDPNQGYLPKEKLIKALESAMVDMVNLCGVDINEAVNEPYTANLLPYIGGLGPRKAQQLLKVTNSNGGVVGSRSELVGDLEQHKLPAVGPRVWNNCASFLMIEFDAAEAESDYLDNTRVHPEDYELGRKMAADALELDEEDIEAEVQENGPGAIVRKLIKDDAQDKVNDLILEEYAEQLEKKFAQRKRATLETIRAELLMPYEELRRNFEVKLSYNEIFTMFTGETSDSLVEGMIVPVSIRRVNDDSVECRLDCGMDGMVVTGEYSDRIDIPAKNLFHPHQTIQAKILKIDRRALRAELSLLEHQLRHPYKREMYTSGNEWDNVQERKDKEEMQEKNSVSGRTQRVIKHPLFRSFNTAQAEEYLGSQGRGEVVIRPSSKGHDHLAVTWKVSDGVYQHIDVLELDKENEFSVGKTLKVGRYSYSDLDELIANHVKAMAKKVDEMALHDKYKDTSKAEADRWLTNYTEANPRRSAYVFCINPKYPGYFFLCFKPGQHAKLQNWSVKVIPNAYELQKIQYPDMKALCNGFKMLFQNMSAQRK